MKLRYAVAALTFVILSGCRFAGTSLFPLRLSYIERIVDVESQLQGPIDDITMGVLFDTEREYLFVLDRPPSVENRLLMFDDDLKLRFSGTASEQGVAGEFGSLMMLAAGFDMIIGNVSIAPDGSFGTPAPGTLVPGDSRHGFSNFADTNWIIDVSDDGAHFWLEIEEYDDAWAPGATGDYRILPWDPNTTIEIEDALYIDDTDEIIVAIHFSPSDEIVLFSFDGAIFPDSLDTPATSWIEEDLYVTPLPEGVEDVARGSVSFTTDGVVYYDREERRLERLYEDGPNLPLDTESGDPSFAFSLFGEEYYYVDPGRGELYKMKTWW